LGGKAPRAVKQIKTVSNAGDLDVGIEAEKRAFAEIFASEDAGEGISAFMAKRRPRWTGR
jgi:enoyl-CoA hydratase/3-hydroxyacyl-CoA dehydrogenase